MTPRPALTGRFYRKHRSGRTRHGSKWLRKALIEAGQAAGRSKDTYLAAQYAPGVRPSPPDLTAPPADNVSDEVEDLALT